MRAYERFLTYAKVYTQSDESSGVTPSSSCQWDLARLLEQELKELGVSDVKLDEQWCIVTGRIPATPGCENAPALGLLAHMDTAPAFSGKDVNPVLHENYDGGDVILPKEGRVIRAADFPFLADLKGKTLITADGTTLLGADDKAGIAEIMTLCERILTEQLPHGELCIAFTPDEEIGEGPNHFDVPAFGAKYAYTVDGGAAGSIEYENFNAAGARVEITGVSVAVFCRRVRLQKAQALLDTTNLELNQIAEKCGFSDESYFIESFRKAYGITPGAYRRQR